MYSRVILRAPEHMQSHWASHRTVCAAKGPFTLILYDSQSIINFAKKKFHHHRFTLCGEWCLKVNLLILSTHHLLFMWLSNRISKYKHAQRYVKPTTLKVATAQHRTQQDTKNCGDYQAALDVCQKIETTNEQKVPHKSCLLDWFVLHLALARQMHWHDYHHVGITRNQSCETEHAAPSHGFNVTWTCSITDVNPGNLKTMWSAVDC